LVSHGREKEVEQHKKKLQEKSFKDMSNDKKRELRYAAEIRQSADGKAKHLFGYAAAYNTPTTIGGQFIEVLMPGCFDRCLAENPDIRCLWGHSDLNVLGRTSAGTLTVRSDSKGLFYDVELPDTQAAQDLWKSVERKDVTGSSFAFFPVKENWIPATKPGELPTRQILECEVSDVSPVAYPAYERGTSVNARSLMPEALRAAMDASDTNGQPVPFSRCDETRDTQWDAKAAANGIFTWADGSDEDRTDAPVKTKLKAAQGFAYVANDGDKRSDYKLPHHVVTKEGTLATHFTGTLRALGDLHLNRVSIPEQHRVEVRSHLQQELDLFQEDEGGSDDDLIESQVERNKLRVAIARLS
jgi:HK97 family phage prohead protease